MLLEEVTNAVKQLSNSLLKMETNVQNKSFINSKIVLITPDN